MTKQIEDYIRENLKGKLQITALEFVAFLRKKNICFYKDNSFVGKIKYIIGSNSRMNVLLSLPLKILMNRKIFGRFGSMIAKNMQQKI